MLNSTCFARLVNILSPNPLPNPGVPCYWEKHHRFLSLIKLIKFNKFDYKNKRNKLTAIVRLALNRDSYYCP